MQKIYTWCIQACSHVMLCEPLNDVHGCAALALSLVKRVIVGLCVKAVALDPTSVHRYFIRCAFGLFESVAAIVLFFFRIIRPCTACRLYIHTDIDRHLYTYVRT